MVGIIFLIFVIFSSVRNDVTEYFVNLQGKSRNKMQQIRHIRKFITALCAVTTACIFFSSDAACAKAPDKRQHQTVVVLDPGHGGKDTGCVGRLTNEKTIVLDVAKSVGKMLDDEMGDSIRTVYTRDTDRFLTLQQRADVANDAKGDIFVSIHVNSVDYRTRGREAVHGASVYTVGLHKSDDNLRVAMRENSVIEIEEDSTAAYRDFDPSSSESYIIFEMSRNRHQRKSIELAALIQDRLTSDAGRADKGVRQAGFWVLWSTGMPSVLVELDFICNPGAEKFLNSKEGREKCARAIADAIKTYIRNQQTA